MRSAFSGHLYSSWAGVTGSRNKPGRSYGSRGGTDSGDVGRENTMGRGGVNVSDVAGFAGFEVCRWEGSCLRSTENARKGTGWGRDKVW